MRDTPFPSKVYLSKVPSRYRQETKLHMSIGPAKNAISNKAYYDTRHDMELWELDGNVWTKLYHIPAGTKSGNLPWQAGK